MKEKILGSNNIKKHQPKKEYSLRSKHNIKTATLSEISHLGERVQHTINEERLLSDYQYSVNECNHRADDEYG